MEHVNKHETANALTHGVAALVSLAGLVLLIIFASLKGTVWHVVSYSIYGTSMVLLFTASTLYHSIQNPVAKRRLRVFDHSAIFLLIAGTYTPITLTAMRGPWGWSLFGCVWGIALVGIGLKIFFTGRFKIVSTLLYLAMGWLVIIAIRPFLRVMPLPGVIWIVAGGLAYTVGVLFYVKKKWPYSHAIWHMFVFGGSVCHYIAIMFYMIQ